MESSVFVLGLFYVVRLNYDYWGISDDLKFALLSEFDDTGLSILVAWKLNLLVVVAVCRPIFH